MITFHTISIDGLDIFYRETGSRDNPTILLLHGFPTSSHMFRNLMPALADRFHLVAPDYPGYGNSSMPTVNEFDYTFDRLAEVMEKFMTAIDLKKYSLYVMDFGAPIGYRIAAKYPERVEALIVQNGNAYEEGLLETRSKLTGKTVLLRMQISLDTFSSWTQPSGNIPTAFAISKQSVLTTGI
jgi:pimeloyl-ACP methyl ester carboxylesterase